MRAEGFLRQWLYNTLGWMHQKRLDTLSALVFSALRGSDLTVTSLGRFLDEATSQKHNIKRADRLLSNKLLQSELLELYRSVNKCILKSIKSPIIHVDWSDIDERQKFFLLRATTALEGRAVTVYEEVHGIETKEKRITHAKFLEKLKKVLPEHSQAIILTDAGFRGPWFRAVEELGWDWIGRVRNRELIKLKTQGNWQGVVDLHPLANKTPKDLGSALLTQSAPLECRIVLYKAKPKGRVKKTKFGKKARTKKSLKNAYAQTAPWLLATSLKNISAKNIIKTYALRMQIEESFRDLKSARFGFGFEYSGTR